jgi:hypothetical protein
VAHEADMVVLEMAVDVVTIVMAMWRNPVQRLSRVITRMQK